MSRASEQPRLWLPQHWPTWLGLGIFWLLNQLPWPAKRALARVLGWFTFYFIRIRRRVVFTNLRLCFPEKSPAEIHRLARAHYNSLALGLFELCAAWWSKNNRLPPYRVNGLAHLTDALARGHGALLLTAHFTNLEICGRYLSLQLPMGGLYRDPNNPVIAQQMRHQRERQIARAVHFENLRGLAHALKDNIAIWYAPDQAKRTKLSTILPFFGVPAITNTATSKIAAMTRTAVVPYFGFRLADGSYELNILPALTDFPTADAEADSVRINRLIENYIRRAPEQYFWVHKRFKARGPGYPDVYAS